MITHSRLIKMLYVIVALVLIAGLAGCGTPAGDQAAAGGQLKGTITISGAFALYPLMVTWGEEFTKVHPDVKFDISAGGAGKGMSDALAGAVDIGMVSRAISPEEEAKGAYWVAVTKDAVFLGVNDKNPVLADLHQKGLTKETLIKIYITGEITTWGQAVGRPDITDPIHVYTRSDSCGASDTWAKYLGNKKQEDLKGIAVYGDPGLADAIVKDPLGMGYNNLNYIYDSSTGKPVAGMAVVPLDANGNGQADPDEVNDTKEAAVNAVATGKYPSPPARDLNVVTKGKPTGLTLAFIQWIMNDGQKLIPEVGYIALPQDQLVQERKKLD